MSCDIFIQTLTVCHINNLCKDFVTLKLCHVNNDLDNYYYEIIERTDNFLCLTYDYPLKTFMCWLVFKACTRQIIEFEACTRQIIHTLLYDQ